MAYGVVFEVSGERACFSRPELKVERMSYDCITPSAAVGILESVYWHPPVRYRIDKIHVLNPIRFTTIRKNEVKSKAVVRSVRTAITSAGDLPYINTKQDIQQRTSTVLIDVRYVIEAHFDIDQSKMEEGDSPAKFAAILRRRLEKGQNFAQPYLGLREYAARVSLYKGELPPQGAYSYTGERDLGIMLYGIDYSNTDDFTPAFFRARMVDGTIDVAGSEVLH